MIQWAAFWWLYFLRCSGPLVHNTRIFLKILRLTPYIFESLRALTITSSVFILCQNEVNRLIDQRFCVPYSVERRLCWCERGCRGNWSRCVDGPRRTLRGGYRCQAEARGSNQNTCLNDTWQKPHSYIIVWRCCTSKNDRFSSCNEV